MSQIHQLQVKFVPVEDRALMRILTHERAEYRFWLTRRFVKLLWKALGGLMQSEDTVARQPDPRARSALVSFQHESAVNQGEFSRPYEEQATVHPLGKTPVLLANIRVSKRDDGTPMLALHPARGQGIELALDSKLVHTLSKLVADAAAAGEWQLDLRVGTGEPRPPPSRERMN